MPAVSEREKLVGAAARLAPFLGDWRVEGDVFASAYGPAGRWSSQERCEWLAGERFLVNRWDARVGERSFQGMAVFGYDPNRGYFARFYDSLGNSPEYRVSIIGPAWTLTGEAQRAVYEFGAGTMEVRWDWRDASGWHPLCTLHARKAQAATFASAL